MTNESESDLLSDLEEQRAEPAGYIYKLLATVIDLLFALMILSLVMAFILGMPIFSAIQHYAVAGFWYTIAAHVVVRLLSIIIWGATPGMVVARICLLDAYGNPLSRKERVLAGLFILYRGVDYYRV